MRGRVANFNQVGQQLVFLNADVTALMHVFKLFLEPAVTYEPKHCLVQQSPYPYCG